MTTVNQEEIQKFSKLAEEWWVVSGKFKPRHMFNPVRIEYILEKNIRTYDITVEDNHTFFANGILTHNSGPGGGGGGCRCATDGDCCGD